MKTWKKAGSYLLSAVLLVVSITIALRGAAAAPAADPTTTQEYLSAALTEVNKAVAAMRSAGTGNRGGFVVKARTDLAQVVVDIKSAITYVTDHPESNPLASGPAGPESPALQPGILAHTADGQTRAPNSYPPLHASIDDLNAALKFLVNNPAGDYRGPVLGNIGGLREKIITGIVLSWSDIRGAMDYGDAHPSAGAARAAAARVATTATVAKGPPGPLTGDQLKALVIIEGDYSRGSGFVAKMYDQYFIVTNEHVLSGNKKITITGLDGTKYPTNGAFYGAMGRDAALLKIPAELAKNYFEIQADALADAKVGDMVTVPGNVEGAGVATQSNGKVLGIGPDLVESDAKMAPGNSGSPIIHRGSEKVLGMATYAIRYQLDNLGKAANLAEVRWFGVRLDNLTAKQWEVMDWTRFSDQGQTLKEIEDFSRVEIAILQDVKLPATNNPKITNALNTLRTDLASAMRSNSKQDYLAALQAFFQRLKTLANSDFSDLANQKLYSYHAGLIKQLQDVRTAIDKGFAASLASMGNLKNSL